MAYAVLLTTFLEVILAIESNSSLSTSKDPTQILQNVVSRFHTQPSAVSSIH